MSLNSFLNNDGLNYLWSKVVNRISKSESNIIAKIPIASDDLPKDLGLSSSSGTSSKFSRSDHVHKVPDDLVSYTDAQTDVEETTKINADLLENHPASDFASKIHADRHAMGGSDPIAPAAIGAVGYNAAQSLTDTQKDQARTNINAAPGGFGLGEAFGQPVTDCDYAKKNGWYYCDKTTANTPDKNFAWYVHVTALGNEVCMQDAFALANVDKYLHRRRLVYVNTAIQNNPWEWVDPPMELGVEYRTTGRYLGKPVYVKTFNIPTSAFENQLISYAHGIDNLDRLVDACVYLRADWIRLFPMSYFGSVEWSAQYMLNSTVIKFEIGSLALERIKEYTNGVDVTLKYTKTTD